MKKYTYIAGLILVWILAGCGEDGPAEFTGDQAYVVEDIPLPDGLTAEVGGVKFLPNGKLMVCFHRGEVMTYDPDSGE